MANELSHKELSEMGARWCKKAASQHGHGCNISIVEGCADRENADVIGFRHSNPAKGSVLIEVKVSRSDFLADKKKPHRKNPSQGMGKWRYFLCPENLITPKDLKNHPKWGLLYGYPNGRIKVIVGPLADKPNWKERSERLSEFAFEEYNFMNEQILLIKSLTRFEELDDMIKLQRLNNKVSNQSMRLNDENRALMSEKNLLQSRIKQKSDQLLKAKVLMNDHGINHIEHLDLTFTTLYDIDELENQKDNLINGFFNKNKDHSKSIAVIDKELALLYQNQHINFIHSVKVRYGIDIGISFAQLIQTHIKSKIGKESLITALNEDRQGQGYLTLQIMIERKLIESDQDDYWLSDSFRNFSFSYIYEKEEFRRLNKQ
ncbi:MAG: hypothetical protein PHG15_00655 [Acinetobacter sp.]|uniref:hypothetical protein n=1 Tax=Acinetobacter sp. TaxID=472 RepID=UPI002611E02D|nr:hypothetical protein [Acinetobacter sp.]MDD2944328.1 hypothetical protein [Acinetobacter sp.]